MRIWLALLLSAVLLLAGCGDDTSPTASDEPDDATSEATSESPSPTKDPTANWPACGEVWKDGAVLSGKYRGCRDGDQAVKADAVPCEFGKRLVTYGDRFWAAPDFRKGGKLIIRRTGGPVKKDAAYKRVRTICMG